jgi:hypothetical protein
MEKLLNLRLDGLQKYTRNWNVLIICLGVFMGEYYISNDSQYQKNEIHVIQGLYSIMEIVID